MKINLIKVEKHQEQILKNLAEYYSYDFSQYYNKDLNENGRFENIQTENYLKNDGNEAFFIKVDEKIAGFMLIKDKKYFKSMAEFWILPKYRKGLLTYRVLKQYAAMIDDLIEFKIIKNNERWLNSLEYMIDKNNEICKIIKKVDFDYMLDCGKYTFTKFLVDCRKNKRRLGT